MDTKVIEPINYHNENYKRMAARHGLTFQFDGYIITEHNEERPATEPELAMWHALVGDFNPECLPATPKEVNDSFQYSPGPFTINPKDFVALLSIPEFNPSSSKDELLSGLFGWFSRSPCQYPPDSPWFYPEQSPVFVSRYIQTGFFFKGPYQPDLHWRPHNTERQLPQDVPPSVRSLVSLNIHPFMSHWY